MNTPRHHSPAPSPACARQRLDEAAEEWSQSDGKVQDGATGAVDATTPRDPPETDSS